MIAFDAFSDGGSISGSTGPLSWSHVCTGSNRLLLVAVSIGAAINTVTGVTYNGVALTKLITTDFNGSIGVLEIWGLVNPASGSNTVAVSFSGSQFMGAAAASYTGVKQSGLPDASNYTDISGVSSASISTSVTTVAGTTWIVAATYSNSGTPSAGTNQTSRGITAARATMIGDTNANQTPGSNSMTSNITPNKTDILQALVSIADVNQGTTGAAFLLNMI